MKKLSMSGQKFLKAVHLVAVGLWLSCVIVLLVIPVIGRHIRKKIARIIMVKNKKISAGNILFGTAVI